MTERTGTSLARWETERRRGRFARLLLLNFSLGATEAFAAVKALVAGPVADRHVAALWARRSILLEVSHCITQVPDLALSRRFGVVFVSVAIPVAFSIPGC